MQTLQLVFSTIPLVLVPVGSILENSLESYIGHSGCTILWLFGTLTNMKVVFSELQLAIFRFLVIKYELTQEKTKKVMKGMVLLDAFFMAFLLAIYLFAIQLTGKKNLPNLSLPLAFSNNQNILLVGTSIIYQFCRGHSAVMDEVIMKYQGTTDETMQTGQVLFHSVILIGQLSMITELIIYVNLFNIQRRHNHNLSRDRTIPQDQIQARHRKNVITLSGQGLTFLVRIFLAMLIHFLIYFRPAGFIDPASFPMWRIIVGSMYEVTYFLSSPELRRFYL